MTSQISVLVIEDNRLVREGLAALLEAQPDFKVVAAADGSSGLPQLNGARPQVVLVDAGLGNQDSQNLVKRVRKESPHSKVIVMDLLPAREDVIGFIQAGANGFILKDATVEDVIRTIRSVAKGTGCRAVRAHGHPPGRTSSIRPWSTTRLPCSKP